MSWLLKPPPIKYRPWLKMDRPWSRIQRDFAGPLDGFYYIIAVDSFSKWPEVLRCWNPTIEVTINFLHKLFARFGVVDCLVYDNGTQYTSGDFKDLKTFNNVTIAPYYRRPNGRAERFVNTLKRARKNARDTSIGKTLQQFLQVYRITPNDITSSSISPAKVMFVWKIRSVFYKLLPKQTKTLTANSLMSMYIKEVDFLFLQLQKVVSTWVFPKCVI